MTPQVRADFREYFSARARSIWSLSWKLDVDGRRTTVSGPYAIVPLGCATCVGRELRSYVYDVVPVPSVIDVRRESSSYP